MYETFFETAIAALRGAVWKFSLLTGKVSLYNPYQALLGLWYRFFYGKHFLLNRVRYRVMTGIR